jgi:hypothetical protein
MKASAVVLFALTITTRALAFPSSRFVYVRGEGAESCPDEPAVRKAVAARLGYDPFFPAADKTIVAQIVRDGDGLGGRVQLVDQQGMVKGLREFKTAPGDCAELVAAMSLAISIAIDPTLQTEAPAPVKPSREREPEEAPQPVPQVDRVEPPSPSAAPGPPSRRQREALEVRPALLATTSVGIAPGVPIGLALSVGVRQKNVSVALEGRRDFPSSTLAPGRGTVSASLWVGTIAPCVHSSALFVCAVGSIGSLRGEGVNVRTPHVDHGLYAAAGGRGGLEVPLQGPLFLRMELDFLATLARVELEVDGAPAWTAPAYSAVLGAGLAGRIP